MKGFGQHEINASIDWVKTRANNAIRQCLYPGCENAAIKSHLLKQKGILHNIKDDENHIFELRTQRMEGKDKYYCFDSIGWERAFTAYCYCNTCDTKLFRTIEEPVIFSPQNMYEARTYSLRPIAHEIRKKQGNIEWREKHESYEHKETLTDNLIINALTTIHNQLVNNELSLEFITREISSKHIAASSVLMWQKPLITPRNNAKENQLVDPKELSLNVINIIPMEQSGILHVSAFDHDSQGMQFLRKISRAGRHELNLILSNTLIHRIEDWCISPELHKSRGKTIETKVRDFKYPNRFDLFYADCNYNFFTNRT